MGRGTRLCAALQASFDNTACGVCHRLRRRDRSGVHNCRGDRSRRTSAALLLFIAAHIDSLISSGRAVSRVRQIARECDVTFVFPPRIAVAENAFLAANTRVLAKNGAVFIVSPYLFSARGVGGKGAYSSLRYEGNGVYIIRRRTYFRLRRKLPQLFSLRGTTFIYL